jgi:hypothetical protein
VTTKPCPNDIHLPACLPLKVVYTSPSLFAYLKTGRREQMNLNSRAFSEQQSQVKDLLPSNTFFRQAVSFSSVLS